MWIVSRAAAMSSKSGGKNPSPSWRIVTRLPAWTGEPVSPAMDGRACSKSSRSGTWTCDSRSLRVDQMIRRSTMRIRT
jgi:hypothetical protein